MPLVSEQRAISTDEAHEVLRKVDNFEHIPSREWVEPEHQLALEYLLAKGWIEPFTQYRLTEAGKQALKP